MSSVKYLHSAMTGAPTLNGTAGSLIAVLDACLVNGFGSGVVDSIVVSGGIATVARSQGHPFEVDSIAEITGATPGALNGLKRVLSVPNINTYTFDATGVSNQTAGGTITHKLAGAGWLKQFSSTNLAAYKSSNVASTGCLMRVDDTGTTNARVVGYESMTDISTNLVGPFPTAAQVSGGVFWAKSASADATSRPWVIVADDRAFYMFVNYGAALTNSITMHFGDFLSNKSPDAYGCSICAPGSSIVGAGSSSTDLALNTEATAASQWIARGVSGLGSSATCRRNVVMPMVTGAVFSGAGSFAFPNPADNGIYLCPFSLIENAGTLSYRGNLPGMYFVPQNVSNSFSTRDPLTGVTSFPGRSFRAIANGSGALFADITGPWR